MLTNSHHIPDDHRQEALSNVPEDEKNSLGHMWDLIATAEQTPHISNEAINRARQNLLSFAKTHDAPVQPSQPPLRLVYQKRWMAIAATLLLGAIGFAWWL